MGVDSARLTGGALAAAVVAAAEAFVLGWRVCVEKGGWGWWWL